MVDLGSSKYSIAMIKSVQYSGSNEPHLGVASLFKSTHFMRANTFDFINMHPRRQRAVQCDTMVLHIVDDITICSQ